MNIVIGEEGRWVSLDVGSGDRFMAGGSGVGWPDRQDIARGIDAFSTRRLLACRTVDALKGTMPVKGPFKPGSADGSNQARGLSGALVDQNQAIGTTSRGLDIIVFRSQEGTPLAIVREIGYFFGTPDRTDGGLPHLERWVAHQRGAGRFRRSAQALPKVQLTAAEEAGKTDRQQIEIRRTKQERGQSPGLVGRRSVRGIVPVVISPNCVLWPTG